MVLSGIFHQDSEVASIVIDNLDKLGILPQLNAEMDRVNSMQGGN